MQNNIPTVYILEVDCCIVKSTNLSTIFSVLYKKPETVLKCGARLQISPTNAQ
jgi:hypothetical protein